LPVWRQVRQPLLALWGERDDRVPPHGSAWLLRRVLRAGGHANSRVVIVPGAGHALAFPGDATSAAAPATAALVAHWLLPG
jgi:pimeloyl-ACP methyl ester carboxylesterase